MPTNNTTTINYLCIIINLASYMISKIIIMQFLLVAFDGEGSDAEELRAKVRPLHLEKIAGLKQRGEFLFGGAILNEEGKMKGSMIVYEVADRKTLEERLKDEPYVNEGVWQKIEIYPFRLAKIE